MRRILVTGMSGTGKSSALAELRELGFRVVDTDEPGWSEWSNQGRFYRLFDAIVLLSAPIDVLLSRVESRTTNSYGKSQEQRELVLRHVAEVEPLLRKTCTHEIDAAQPLAGVVHRLAELGREPVG